MIARSRPFPAPRANANPHPSGHRALRHGRTSFAHGIYFVTTVTRQRERVFADFQLACIAARCLCDARVTGDARMLAWVLMPDHAHWLLELGDVVSLDVAVARIKSAVARKVNRARDARAPLWNRAYHDHALRREEDLRGVADYLIANPLRAGLAQRIGDYPFWNSVWV